ASIAGLLPTALDPIYGANKSAVVGLVRALGPSWADHRVRVNALCPGFADTEFIDGVRDLLADTGIEVMDPETVVDVFMTILTSDSTGECWPVLPGLPSQPFQFAEIPGYQSVYPEATSVRRSR
ncbi:MAG: SDR family NAD(P)-dependent oxidoreductase, partial [Candidatus Dormibacteraceae bacterium]